MIAALAADQTPRASRALHVVERQRDLERGVDRFRTRVTEEHMIEIAGRQRARRAASSKAFGCANWNGALIHLGRLGLDRSNDPIAVVPALVHTGRRSHPAVCGRPA